MMRKTRNFEMLITAAIFGMSASLSGFAQSAGDSAATRTEEKKRFDFNRDGRLSEAEIEIMIETITREAFTPTAINEQAIRERRRGRPARFGMPDRFRRGRGVKSVEKISERFDADGNGKLSNPERRAAREYIRERRAISSPSRSSGKTQFNTTFEDDEKASEAGAVDGEANLYDENTLRTFYLRFYDDDWYAQLGDFYRTDIDVPADLTVDGKVYPSVGIRFRGSSSYFTVQNEKKSFNITIDNDNQDQRLYGYKTLNLLNGHSDASFLREVLYSRIARNYIPAPRANFVKLVINGQNWGIYINSQQLNKDFLSEWFNSKNGVRWKVPPGREGGLIYNGDDPINYQQAYQLKTNNEEAPAAWTDLVNLCKILEKTSDDQLEAELSRIFNIDGALWFLALENVFIDNDGYFSRASDYALYQDPNGRFHLLQHDSNETFRFAGSGGPNSWETDGPMLSPVAQEHDEMRPVIKRLFAIPHLRARYLAHLRTVVTESLDWGKLSPTIERYRSLIDEEVRADGKKLYSYGEFATSHIQDETHGFGFGPPGGFGRRAERGDRSGSVAPSFKRFIKERHAYLLAHVEVDRPTPVIQAVSVPKNPLPNERLEIVAKMGVEIELDEAVLYFATGGLVPFESVLMSKNGTIYSGEIPGFPAGTRVRYYVEVRSAEAHRTATFFPPNTEFAPLTYRVALPIATDLSVVINELMANNTQSITDPQGEYDDWIELHNPGEDTIDLSGMYLSDSQINPRKWKFPEQTKIRPKGYLIIWADSDERNWAELHANFKLSKRGEMLILVDADERGNQLVDSIKFEAQKPNTAIGRIPNGTGDLMVVTMTPGTPNR